MGRKNAFSLCTRAVHEILLNPNYFIYARCRTCPILTFVNDVRQRISQAKPFVSNTRRTIITYSGKTLRQFIFVRKMYPRHHYTLSPTTTILPIVTIIIYWYGKFREAFTVFGHIRTTRVTKFVLEIGML